MLIFRKVDELNDRDSMIDRGGCLKHSGPDTKLQIRLMYTASMATTASGEEHYLLRRTQEEADRLNAQHKLFVSKTGLLHPEIPRRPDFKVADIGTGTGAFLLDMASQSAKGQYRGFDISSAHFPSPEALAKGVDISFLKQNILEPFPSEFNGYFDIAHLRLLILALASPPQWADAITNVLPILKPGGWVQWVEIDIRSCRVVPVSTEEADLARIKKIATEFQQILDTWMPLNSGPWSMASMIAELFEEKGLQSINSRRQVWIEDSPSRETILGMNRNLISVIRNAWPMMLKRMGPVDAVGMTSPEGVTAFIDRLEDAIGGSNGAPLRASLSLDVWTTVGSKKA